MLKPGDSISTFVLPALIDGRGSRLTLAKISSGLVVLFSYSRDFYLIGPTEGTTGVGKALNLFGAEKAPVLGVSVDDEWEPGDAFGPSD